MVSVYDSDISVSDLSASDIHAMSTKAPLPDRVSDLFTGFADPETLTGNMSSLSGLFINVNIKGLLNYLTLTN